MARLSTRDLHPLAWWVWALGLAAAASRTTNPLLLGLVIGVACLALGACGSEPESSGRLVLEHEHVETGRMYIEGFEQFVELHGRDTELRRRFDGERLELTVPAGSYTLVSYSRPCSAHCGDSLDPPRSYCEKRVTVGRGKATAWTVRTKVEARCSIRTRRAPAWSPAQG